MINEVTAFTESLKTLTERMSTARAKLRRFLTALSLPKFVRATDSLWFKIYKTKLTKYWRIYE